MYKKTQIGKLLISIVSFTVLITAIGGTLALEYLSLAPTVILYSISGILLICLMLFSTLTIVVESNLITIRYGIGLIRKRIQIDQLDSWQAIEYKGGHGWGPRLTSEGWFFNVAESGAVRLNYKNGKVFFFGTNEPKKVIDALDSK